MALTTVANFTCASSLQSGQLHSSPLGHRVFECRAEATGAPDCPSSTACPVVTAILAGVHHWPLSAFMLVAKQPSSCHPAAAAAAIQQQQQQQGSHTQSVRSHHPTSAAAAAAEEEQQQHLQLTCISMD